MKKFLFDLFPLVLFFAAFKLYDIYVATGVAIAASFFQIGWLYFRKKKIDPMLWVTLVIVTVFGGATIYFQNENFIKWKPTVLYWLFASALLIAQFGFNTNFMRKLMGKELVLPDDVWSKVNISWALFFAFFGVLNLYIAYNFPTEIWVNFKLFGWIVLMIIFVIVQGIWLHKYIPNDESK
jgi:intracellular septation protein